jgi:putative nucleotidyltransferase with HDIG domain
MRDLTIGWRTFVLIPLKQECFHLLRKVAMPDHIRAHSCLVCRVALVLTDGLIAAGVGIDRRLVRAAALLHDITKPRSFKTGENHAQTGGAYLAELGFPEVGEVVRQHVILDRYFAKNEPEAAEVVNYADKRVLHDRVVPLDDRMTYILNRYAQTRELRKQFTILWDQTRVLEKRLFSYLSFHPDIIPPTLIEAALPT